MAEADPIRRLIHAFSRLPGIGEKSAARLAFFVLDAEPHVASELAAALTEVRARIRKCSLCQNLTEQDPCRFCADGRRDAGLICVVENVQGLLAIERTGEFRGRYHVLHGRLSPLDGVGPDQIHIRELLGRLAGVTEIIVATSPSVEGEATALYIQRMFAPEGLQLTRLATGIPVGGALAYTDEATLQRAFQHRRGF